MMSRSFLPARARYRALGVGCLGTLIVACSGSGPERLVWEVEFACPSDALATTQLTFEVLKGGCDGSEVLYEETLVRGGSLPTRKLDPGSYGLMVSAGGQGGVVAVDCSAHELPSSEPIVITLRSASCLGPDDAGLDAMPADASADAELPEAEPPCMPPMDCRPCAEDGDTSDCPPTSCTEQSHAGHSYLFCSDKQQWGAARTECRKLNRDLTVIDNAEENAFVTAHIGGATHWIGANDRGNNGINSCSKSGDEGVWNWVNPVSGKDQGTNFCNASGISSSCGAVIGTYVSWASGEPNNDTCECIPFYRCEEGEDCGAISGPGTWQDQECRASLPYVCESY